MICPKCKQEWNGLTRNSFWLNSGGYRVQVLDFGSSDVWVLYLDNSNRVAWRIKDFLEQYNLETPNAL